MHLRSLLQSGTVPELLARRAPSTCLSSRQSRPRQTRARAEPQASITATLAPHRSSSPTSPTILPASPAPSDHHAELLMTSPPPRVPSACQVGKLILLAMKCTEP